jgi:hypothetical protein
MMVVEMTAEIWICESIFLGEDGGFVYEDIPGEVSLQVETGLSCEDVNV